MVPIPPPLWARTAVVLVIFRQQSPDVRTLAGWRRAVGHALLVDNAAAPQPDWHATCAEQGAGYIHNGNRGMLAGAYNRALEHLRLHHPKLSHVLLIDQDSDTTGLPRFLHDAQVSVLADDPNTAVVSAAYRDAATGLRARYLRLSRWLPHYLPREFDGVQNVDFTINSMSLWSLQLLQRLGPFDEELALDHIDTDMCLRARRAGLGVLVHGGHEFLHRIGQRRRFTLLGREMQAGGHAPARRRLIARNTIWLMRRELWRCPAFAVLACSRLAYEVVGIIAAEPDKLRKLAALLWGTLQGMLPRRTR